MIHHTLQKVSLFGRHHLHLVPALIFSASLHYGLVHFWPQQPTQKNVESIQQPLKIVLVRQSNTLNQLDAQTATDQNKTSHRKKKRGNEAPTYARKNLENTPVKVDHYTEYFSPKDVEIQALPIVNIDLSMLPQQVDVTDLQQQLPIQLRLYIDEFGQVVRVERIAMVLAQDDALASALEDLLKDVKFTPAKRASAEVKSYQDVAFDFKANF